LAANQLATASMLSRPVLIASPAFPAMIIEL
jgi:hypothetical protein